MIHKTEMLNIIQYCKQHRMSSEFLLEVIGKHYIHKAEVQPLVKALDSMVKAYEEFQQWESDQPDSFYELDEFTGQSFATLSSGMYKGKKALENYKRKVGE